MLDIMLCGASDIKQVQSEFDTVAQGFGARSWHYVSGLISHENTLTSSWVKNSSATVRNMDICVFVVVERIGEITWETEFREALNNGKAVRILCREDTYGDYITLRQQVSDPAAISPEKRKLVEVMSELEFEWQQTVVPYQFGTFSAVLRVQLAMLFSDALRAMEKRARHAAVEALLDSPGRLNATDFDAIAEIAVDEFATKHARKRAIRALAERQAATDELVHQLTQSPEPAVQRIAIENIARLYRTRPAEAEMFDHLVAVVNQSDDTELARRLIPSLLGIDLQRAVNAMTVLDLSDIGARRRLAQELEAREQLITGPRIRADALTLLERCMGSQNEANWKERCREFADRLSA